MMEPLSFSEVTVASVNAINYGIYFSLISKDQVINKMTKLSTQMFPLFYIVIYIGQTFAKLLERRKKYVYET